MIWLIGMMGSGKSTIGEALADSLGEPFVDSDAEVERETGLTVRQLWEQRGEAALRHEESGVVRRLAGSPAGIVATGGGVVLDPGNVEEMRRSGTVVWLRASPGALAARIEGTARPLLDVDDVEARLAEILNARESLYRRAAHVTVDTEGADIASVLASVTEAVA